MSNAFFQGKNADGICTAASLAWCRACLLGRRINTFADIGINQHALNAQMAVLRKYDHDPGKQSELAGLVLVRESNIGSVDEVTSNIKGWAPHVGIFWTATHTMGYRYAHHEKEFFDVENGLYRAKYTADIKAMIEGFGYGTLVPITGCRIVRR